MLASLFLAAHGFALLARRRRFSPPTSARERAERRRIGVGFGVLLALEGAGIGVAVSLLARWGAERLQVPVTALIVGLHFYPMARLFRRSVDYFIATWACAAALSGLALMRWSALPTVVVCGGVGLGMAVSTLCYGLYMLREKRRALAVSFLPRAGFCETTPPIRASSQPV